jgi:hypothetical protein
VIYHGTVPPLKSMQNTKIHMKMPLFGNCFFVLDNGYAAKSIHTMLAPVPNTTRLIDTRKEVKKFPSPKIFLYDRRLNPTGQRAVLLSAKRSWLEILKKPIIY